jgi:hypothetical protein
MCEAMPLHLIFQLLCFFLFLPLLFLRDVLESRLPTPYQVDVEEYQLGYTHEKGNFYD